VRQRRRAHDLQGVGMETTQAPGVRRVGSGEGCCMIGVVVVVGRGGFGPRATRAMALGVTQIAPMSLFCFF
jgi:hypothetical protein